MSTSLIDQDVRRQQAKQRLLVIHNAFEVADEELERAFVERDWEVLGRDSWEDYCAAMPGYRHFKMKAVPRRERVAKLRAKGANIPQLKAATGASVGTIHNDLALLEGGHRRESVSVLKDEPRQPAEMPATTSSPTAPTYVLAARAIARCGASGGGTPEVMADLGWQQGPASVALSRAAKKKLVVPTGERRHATTTSIGFTVYRADYGKMGA